MTDSFLPLLFDGWLPASSRTALASAAGLARSWRIRVLYALSCSGVMLDSGVPRRACIGAVANEGDEAVEAGGVVGFDVILFDEVCGLLECV